MSHSITSPSWEWSKFCSERGQGALWRQTQPELLLWVSIRKLGFTVSFLRTSATEADSFYMGSENTGDHFEYRFQGYDCHAGIRSLTLGSRAHMVSAFLDILASVTDISTFYLLGERIIIDMTISCSNSLALEWAPDNGEGRQVLGLFLRISSCVMLVSVCAICTP